MNAKRKAILAKAFSILAWVSFAVLLVGALVLNEPTPQPETEQKSTQTATKAPETSASIAPTDTGKPEIGTVLTSLHVRSGQDLTTDGNVIGFLAAGSTVSGSCSTVGGVTWLQTDTGWLVVRLDMGQYRDEFISGVCQ